MSAPQIPEHMVVVGDIARACCSYKLYRLHGKSRVQFSCTTARPPAACLSADIRDPSRVRLSRRSQDAAIRAICIYSRCGQGACPWVSPRPLRVACGVSGVTHGRMHRAPAGGSNTAPDRWSGTRRSPPWSPPPRSPRLPARARRGPLNKNRPEGRQGVIINRRHN